MKKLLVLSIFFELISFAETYIKPLNLTLIKRAVAHHYQSGLFETECQGIINSALNYLQSLEGNLTDKKTIIFDVDDTVLFAFKHLETLDYCKHCGNRLFDEFVHNANVPTIAPIKQLYDYCVEQKYHIIFLTARFQTWYNSTIKNLALHGYTTFDHLICKADVELSLPSGVYKSNHRTALVAQGLEIVATVGDQPTDFEGLYVGYAIRIPNYTHIL